MNKKKFNLYKDNMMKKVSLVHGMILLTQNHCHPHNIVLKCTHKFYLKIKIYFL